MNTRLLGIDYGEKRVGIALSDDKGLMAFPHAVLANGKKLVDEVAALAAERGVSTIVLGDSMNYKGERNRIMKEALALAETLRAKGFAVELEQEVLTSHQAAHFQGKTAMTDAAAASIILQSYIDRTAFARDNTI